MSDITKAPPPGQAEGTRPAPGSTHLKCPEVLRRKNWYARTSTAEEDAEILAWRVQAAYRLRAALRSLPFYARRAQQEKEHSGSEMPYWFQLQGSEMTLERRPPTEAVGLDQPEDADPVNWLHDVELLLLCQRGWAPPG